MTTTNESTAPPQQETFYEAVWTSEGMSDADKAHWLYETCKDYWGRLEAAREGAAPLRYLWIVALAHLDEDAVLWQGEDIFGPVVLTVDDIRRALHPTNPYGSRPLTDEQIADGLAKAFTRVRRPADAPALPLWTAGASDLLGPHPDDADEAEGDEDTIRVTVELRPKAGWARLTRGDRTIDVEPSPEGESWHIVEDDSWGKSKPSFAYAFLEAWYYIAEPDERPPLWMSL